MKFLNNIKNAKKNWHTVQQSPYASLHFKYQTTRATIVLFSAFIVYQIIKIALSYQGYDIMSWIMRLFTLAIGVLIVVKAFQTLEPMKRAMEPYKKNKNVINHTDKSAKLEIEDLLQQFDSHGKRIIHNHLGETELNK